MGWGKPGRCVGRSSGQPRARGSNTRGLALRPWRDCCEACTYCCLRTGHAKQLAASGCSASLGQSRAGHANDCPLLAALQATPLTLSSRSAGTSSWGRTTCRLMPTGTTPHQPLRWPWSGEALAMHASEAGQRVSASFF